MSNQHNAPLRSAAGKVLSVFLVGLAFGAGCDPEEKATVRVKDAVLVGASGHFYADKGELRIDVSPKDEQGHFVGQGLPQSAFSFEDVVMRPVDQVGGDVSVSASVKSVSATEADPDVVLEAVVIFDSSGSMSDNDPDAMGRRLGGTALFDALGPKDRVAVLDFGAGSTSPLQASRLLQDFTSDRMLLDAALDKLDEAGGTPLYQSILEGINLLADNAEGGIPALVVLTDGKADDDFMFEDAVMAAQAKHIPIYAIGLGKQLDFTDLSRVTEQTGGSFIESPNAVDLERAFAGVSSGIRSGSVTVTGEGMYTLPAGPLRYRVSGNLVTTDSAKTRALTPFSFTVDIAQTDEDPVDAGNATTSQGDGAGTGFTVGPSAP